MVMTSATEAYPLSGAERKDRAALLKRLGVNFAPPDAEIIPLDHEVRKRRPLGLAPILDGDPEAAPKRATYETAFASDCPSVGAGLGEATLQRAASMADVVTAADTAIAIAMDGEAVLKARLSEMRGENARLETELARLRAQFAEAKAEFAEAKHILERLQITREGKRGERGPCGADGAPGPRGERGPRRETGRPAPVVIEWRADPEAFTISAILSDGSAGPMIALRSLFEAYHNATSWLEDADIVQAAHEARIENERQIEAHRWAK